MWGVFISWALRILPAIPQLISAVEGVFAGQPASGPQKWLAVEQALSQSISSVAADLAKLAPPGSDPQKISAAVALYTKAVNDATVAFANGVGIFTHSG
jgi:hypothetical protein